MEAPGIEACAGHVKIDQSSVIHEESEGDDPPQNAVENVGPPPTPPRVKICDPNRFLIAEQVFKSDASSGEAERQALSRQLREARDLIAQLQRELERARAVIEQQRDIVSRATRQNQQTSARRS